MCIHSSPLWLIRLRSILSQTPHYHGIGAKGSTLAFDLPKPQSTYDRTSSLFAPTTTFTASSISFRSATLRVCRRGHQCPPSDLTPPAYVFVVAEVSYCLDHHRRHLDLFPKERPSSLPTQFVIVAAIGTSRDS